MTKLDFDTNNLKPITRLWNVDEIIGTVKRLDKSIRTFAIICPPCLEDSITKELGHQYIIISDPACPVDKCYLINRKDFEKFTGVEL